MGNPAHRAAARIGRRATTCLNRKDVGKVALALVALAAGAVCAFSVACDEAIAPAAGRSGAAAAADVVLDGMPAGLMPPAHPCKPEDVPQPLVRDGQDVLLTIPDRDHEPGHPPQGWCGEVAIQEAALYHGAWFPQKMINAAGKPTHPDLYAGEIPVALAALGLEFEVCRRESRDLGRFLTWLAAEIGQGRPALVGVKVYPTKHDDWILDHFMLGVGVKGDAFVFNTTWGRQESRTRGQLSSTEKGYAFKNRFDRYYGIGIRGQAGLGGDHVPVRLFRRAEGDERMTLLVRCEGLVPRARYVVYRLASRSQTTAKPLAVFEPAGREYAFRETIPKNAPAIYRCRRVAAQQRRGATE